MSSKSGVNSTSTIYKNWLEKTRESYETSLQTAIVQEKENKLKRRDTLQQLYEKTPPEEVLLQLISSLEKDEIRKLLEEEKYRSQINPKKCDLEGHSILTRGVLSKDKDLLEILLEYFGNEVDLKDAKITCVKEDLGEMLETLLTFEDEEEEEEEEDERKEVTGGGDMMTPFLLAAQKGNYEVMQLLYDRGERLPLLHMPNCPCPQCTSRHREIENSIHRVNILEAMANPVYNIFMAEQNTNFDPVYETFTLQLAVQRCIRREPQFKDHYEAILKYVADLPKDLIDECRSVEETQIFLSPTLGYIRKDDSFPYPRLIYAIESDQKEFVSNANIQFVLQTDFVGHPWNPANDFEQMLKIFLIFVYIFLFGIHNLYIWVAMICCAKSPAVKYPLSPVNRCWSKLGSYLWFCAILIYMNGKSRSEGQIEDHVRYLRWIVFVFFASHSVSLVQQYIFDWEAFWKSGWNVFDLLTKFLFGFTFATWLWDYKVYKNSRARKTIEADDVVLLGECSFALATSFSIVRILRWYILCPKLGPLQTAMSRMARNVNAILVFFIWTSLTFTVGPSLLLKPYQHLKGVNQSALSKIIPWVHLDTYIRQEVSGNEEGLQYQKIIQKVIWLLFIVHKFGVINFLRSSVTGMFASAQKAVFNAKHVEWKYLRAKEWLYYLHDTTMAPPFNLLPHALCIFKMAKRKDEEALNSQEELRQQYPSLLKKLFQRYLHKKRMQNDKSE